MTDIKIEDNTLPFENGDLQMVNNVDRIIQHIGTGLYMLKGDWVLDYTQGIDYLSGLKKYPNVLRAEVKNAISTVDGIDRVTQFDMTRTNNIYNITATVTINAVDYIVTNEVKL